MASQAQRAANRRNAVRSTGPRTAAGKLKVSKNAVRHGLASIGSRPPAIVNELNEMATLISAPHEKDPIIRSLAQTIAEAQAQRDFVRKHRAALLDDVLALAEWRARDAASYMRPAARGAAFARSVLALSERLLALERYAERAHRRKMKAIRLFPHSPGRP
jgi:hypothetical protein